MRSGYAPPLIGTPTAEVTVAAAGRDVTSVSTVRELGGGGVPGMNATAAASGGIEWAGTTVQDGPSPSPWNRVGNFPPTPGSDVTVSVGTIERGVYSMLTGVVDDSAAGSDGIVTSNIVDPVDQLHRKITYSPLLASMPPLEVGGQLRNIGLSSDFIVDILLRRCAMFSTPYQPAAVKGVNVPGQGSAWPERGTCLTAGQRTTQAQGVDFLSSEWGWGIYDCDATYAPDGNFTIAGGAEISCMVSQYHAATSDLTLSVNGSNQWFRLVIGATRAVSAQYYNGATTTTIATLPAAPDYRRVTMRISAGSVWLGTNDGRVATGTHTAPSAVTTANVSQLGVRVIRGGRVGGIIAGNMPAGNYFNQTLNARLYAGTNLNPKLIASPRIENKDALDQINEIAQATCRAYWWDEDGLFVWIPGDYMLLREPDSRGALTSLDNLLDLGWSEALADTYAQVSVDFDDPVVARSATPNVTVWQGSGDSMANSESVEEIVAPSTDEEWIRPDLNPREAWDSAWVNDINHGRWSVKGGVRTDGTSTWWARNELDIADAEQIGPFAWKFTYETTNVPAGQSVQRAFPNDDASTGYWMRWRNEKLPIIRAYGKVEWAADSITQGSGNGTAGVYQHSGGKWIQGYSRETPGRIADFLEEWLCKPRVKATNVAVVHDARVQVGDVVTVRDEHAHGIELKVLITRVDQSTTVSEQTMSLDFFVIEGAPAWVTLAQHDAAQTSTFAAHNTSQGGETLDEHNSDPRHSK